MERTLFQSLCIWGKNIMLFASVGLLTYLVTQLEQNLEIWHEKRQNLRNKRKRKRTKSLKR